MAVCDGVVPGPAFDQDSNFLGGRVRLRCTFREAARYSIQLWFFQYQGSDVLKGELPFYVVEEGG
jgi:hypothetical protein